jgi:hypothetical protein
MLHFKITAPYCTFPRKILKSLICIAATILRTLLKKNYFGSEYKPDPQHNVTFGLQLTSGSGFPKAFHF